MELQIFVRKNPAQTHKSPKTQYRATELGVIPKRTSYYASLPTESRYSLTWQVTQSPVNWWCDWPCSDCHYLEQTSAWLEFISQLPYTECYQPIWTHEWQSSGMHNNNYIYLRLLVTISECLLKSQYQRKQSAYTQANSFAKIGGAGWHWAFSYTDTLIF